MGLNIGSEQHVVNLLVPTANTAGVGTSDTFKMTNAGVVNIVVTTGTVTNAATITVRECTAAAGTSATAIVFNYYNTATADSDTFTALTAATVGGISTGTTNNLTWVIPIHASELTDGYDWINVHFTTAAAIAISAVAVLGDLRYASETNLTAIA